MQAEDMDTSDVGWTRVGKKWKQKKLSGQPGGAAVQQPVEKGSSKSGQPGGAAVQQLPVGPKAFHSSFDDD